VASTVYPETADRSLESIEALFSTSSPFNWKMEEAYRTSGDVLAVRGLSVSSQAGYKERNLQSEDV